MTFGIRFVFFGGLVVLGFTGPASALNYGNSLHTEVVQPNVTPCQCITVHGDAPDSVSSTWDNFGQYGFAEASDGGSGALGATSEAKGVDDGHVFALASAFASNEMYTGTLSEPLDIELGFGLYGGLKAEGTGASASVFASMTILSDPVPDLDQIKYFEKGIEMSTLIFGGGVMVEAVGGLCTILIGGLCYEETGFSIALEGGVHWQIQFSMVVTNDDEKVDVAIVVPFVFNVERTALIQTDVAAVSRANSAPLCQFCATASSGFGNTLHYGALGPNADVLSWGSEESGAGRPVLLTVPEPSGILHLASLAAAGFGFAIARPRHS